MDPLPTSSYDNSGRTLVLAFDGSNNQFNDEVSRIFPTPTTKALTSFMTPLHPTPG